MSDIHISVSVNKIYFLGLNLLTRFHSLRLGNPRFSDVCRRQTAFLHEKLSFFDLFKDPVLKYLAYSFEFEAWIGFAPTK